MLHNVVDEQQHLLQMIRQLGTPVLPIYRRIVVLPLVGHVDSSRAEHVMDAVLAAIVRYQAAVVLIDITGVTVVDTAVANSLIQTVRAADADRCAEHLGGHLCRGGALDGSSGRRTPIGS